MKKLVSKFFKNEEPLIITRKEEQETLTTATSNVTSYTKTTVTNDDLAADITHAILFKNADIKNTVDNTIQKHASTLSFSEKVTMLQAFEKSLVKLKNSDELKNYNPGTYTKTIEETIKYVQGQIKKYHGTLDLANNYQNQPATAEENYQTVGPTN